MALTRSIDCFGEECMSRAGVFAGELSTIAPVDGASTTKPAGYVWLQYGEPLPGQIGKPDYKEPEALKIPIRRWQRNS